MAPTSSSISTPNFGTNLIKDIRKHNECLKDSSSPLETLEDGGFLPYCFVEGSTATELNQNYVEDVELLKDLTPDLAKLVLNNGAIVVEYVPKVASSTLTSNFVELLIKEKKTINYYLLCQDEQTLTTCLNNSPFTSSSPTSSVQVSGLYGSLYDLVSFWETLDKSAQKLCVLPGFDQFFSHLEYFSWISFLRKLLAPGDLILIGSRNFRNYNLTTCANLTKIDSPSKKDSSHNQEFENLKKNGSLVKSTDNSCTVRPFLKCKSRIITNSNLEIQPGELLPIGSHIDICEDTVAKLANINGLNIHMEWSGSSSRRMVRMLQVPLFYMQPAQSVDGSASLNEFENFWRCWDVISEHMIPSQLHLEKPISLRHPFIFYFGHLATFADVQIARCLKEPVTPPNHYQRIFERGIDPDMDDPSHCHDHSEVPDQWPEFEQIMSYKLLVRDRIRKLFHDHANSGERMKKPLRRILFIVLEHYGFHVETFMFMVVQSKLDLLQKLPQLLKPHWVICHAGARCKLQSYKFLDAPRLLKVKESVVKIGHEDMEQLDSLVPEVGGELGWDNERPVRFHSTNPFVVESRQITNAEYYTFFKASNFDEELFPASWMNEGEIPAVRTIFGPCPVFVKDDQGILQPGPSANWPAQVSMYHAESYCQWKSTDKLRYRLLSEAEWVAMIEQYPTDPATWNVGFRHWTPQPLQDVDTRLGNVYDWTSTKFCKHPGFYPSPNYPGYSADFFDDKHVVIRGGAWTTPLRMVSRKSFRNWFQTRYPYMFAGFRCVVEAL